MKKNVLNAIKCNATFLADEIPKVKIAGNWEISPTLL